MKSNLKMYLSILRDLSLFVISMSLMTLFGIDIITHFLTNQPLIVENINYHYNFTLMEIFIIVMSFYTWLNVILKNIK